MKGFIISFDAMVALAVTFVLFITASSYLAAIDSSANTSAFLRDFSMDSAATLEKSGIASQAIITGSNTDIRGFVNAMPPAICLEIKAFNSADIDTAVLTVVRSDCSSSFSEKTAYRRNFIAGGADRYILEVNAWFKE